VTYFKLYHTVSKLKFDYMMSQKCPEWVSIFIKTFVTYLELNCNKLQIDVSLTGISLKDKFCNTNPNTNDDAKEEIQVLPVSTKALHALLQNFIFIIRFVMSQE